MLSIIKRVLKLAGEFAGKIKLAMFVSFFEAIFNNVPIFIILYILIGIMNDALDVNDVWISGGIIITALLLQCVLKRVIYVLQSGTGFEIFARERIKIGDRFKRFPMGYFSEGNKGYISAVITSDINFIEMYAMNAIDKVVIAYVNAMVACIFLLIIDYRIAVISILAFLIGVFLLKKILAVGKKHSVIRQDKQSELVSAVLEYVQGMSVIKAFNMSGDKAKATKKAFEEFRDISIEMEKGFMPYIFRFESIFALGIGLTILLASSFTVYGSLNMSIMLMIFVFIFRIYLPFNALSLLSAEIRIMEAGLDRYDALKNIEIIDENGRDIKLDSFDIEFKDVSFAYDDKKVLQNISFAIPEKSMTALVGSSGSGKTTIANLIARFWDVQKGEVRVGGVNVKEMTCDSLLSNISMVFQNVYLFNDTIFNNIKFGNPEASREEVIAAAKKARCHDFIMELPDGYDTMVDEGGSSLSGGEKQRISIARAILKDAPIILLDEATASVDPENEKYIQLAINELVKDKTLVVIAHRLSTIRSANQILVLENGNLVQKGNHNQLVEEEGKYKDFWDRRMKAKSWEISKATLAKD